MQILQWIWRLREKKTDGLVDRIYAMQTKEEAFEKLKKSEFRSRFHLREQDLMYIDEKGMDTIRSHAEDFIRQKLVSLVIY